MPNKRKFNIKTEKEITQFYREGKTTIQLAQQYSVHSGLISDIIRRHGVKPLPKNTRNRKIQDISFCQKSYYQGKGILTIAKENNVSYKTMHKALERIGTVFRPQNVKIIPNNPDVIIQDYQRGMSAAEVAKIHSTTDWVVLRILKENNIETRISSHPSRKEQSRLLMSERIHKYGWMRCGIHEKRFIFLLKEQYDEVIHQYRIEKGGHYFDAFAGGILWELDEPAHKGKRQRQKDIKYDQRANELGYEVRRVWLSDLEIYGITKYYSLG